MTIELINWDKTVELGQVVATGADADALDLLDDLGTTAEATRRDDWGAGQYQVSRAALEARGIVLSN